MTTRKRTQSQIIDHECDDLFFLIKDSYNEKKEQKNHEILKQKLVDNLDNNNEPYRRTVLRRSNFTNLPYRFCRNSQHETLLTVACSYSRKHIVETLLKISHLDIDVADKYGSTPLHIACSEDETDIVNMLLSRRADVNITDNKGVSPLHTACVSGKEIATVLISAGADINKSDHHGWLPFTIACLYANKPFLNTQLFTLFAQTPFDYLNRNMMKRFNHDNTLVHPIHALCYDPPPRPTGCPFCMICLAGKSKDDRIQHILKHWKYKLYLFEWLLQNNRTIPRLPIREAYEQIERNTITEESFTEKIKNKFISILRRNGF